MKTNIRLFALSMLALPMLAACSTYTNDEYSGYGYDRDNMKGHNDYRPEQTSYMNYQQVDTHCAESWCKGSHKDGEGMLMDGKHYNGMHHNKGDMKVGMTAPDGSPLMKAKASNEAAALSKASKECRKYDGIRVWKKGEWKGHYVVKYTCFNK